MYPLWLGSFTITAKIRMLAYRLDIPPRHKQLNTSFMSACESQCMTNDNALALVCHSLLQEIEGGLGYEVESILAHGPAETTSACDSGRCVVYITFILWLCLP